MIDKTIRIRLLKHKDTDLLMAVSDELRGLVLHGRSVDEIERRLPAAIGDLLRAEGFDVVSMSLMVDKAFEVPDFGPPAFIANASLTGHP